MAKSMASQGLKLLKQHYPWVQTPFIVSAPMRVMAGAQLAVAATQANGLGFIGPGAKPSDSSTELERAAELLRKKGSPPNTTSDGAASAAASPPLPVGIGFQTWNGDIEVAAQTVRDHRPCAAWLFAPRHGQQELNEWTRRIREACPETRVWVQVGTLGEAVAAAESAHPPDVLVLQGAEAGGHGRTTDAIGLVTLVPEVQDAIGASGIPLVAAGGIADARGVVAALALGASGVAMGTRFLASTEARIGKGYRDEVVRARDGATCTTRTQLYNHLRGTFGWPEQFSPRTIVNQSWHDHRAGVSFEELQRRHDEAAQKGDEGWGPEGRLATYAGASVGLVRSVDDAGVIIRTVREEAARAARAIMSDIEE